MRNSVTEFYKKEKLLSYRNKINTKRKEERNIQKKYKSANKLAETLRKNATGSEKKLREHLLTNSIPHTFQKPVVTKFGKIYVVDFYVKSNKPFGIEVDGEYHNDEIQRLKDDFRASQLRKEGVPIIRFTNADVTFKINDVIEEIFRRIDYQLI